MLVHTMHSFSLNIIKHWTYKIGFIGTFQWSSFNTAIKWKGKDTLSTVEKPLSVVFVKNVNKLNIFIF